MSKENPELLKGADEMILNRKYRSKRNGRVYIPFYKSEWEENCYSLKPVEPTEDELRIFPFPHIRIDYNPNEWELLPEGEVAPSAKIIYLKQHGKDKPLLIDEAPI